MRSLLIAGLALGSIAVSAAASAQGYVRGYVRPDGSVVPPHMQTSPGSGTYDRSAPVTGSRSYTGQPVDRDPYSGYSSPAYNTNPYATGSGSYRSQGIERSLGNPPNR